MPPELLLLPPLLDEELDELGVPEEPEEDADAPDEPDEPDEPDDDGFEPPESAVAPPASESCGVVLPEGSAASGAAGSVGCVVVSAPAPVPVSVEPTAQARRLTPIRSATLEVAACARTRADSACCTRIFVFNRCRYGVLWTSWW